MLSVSRQVPEGAVAFYMLGFTTLPGFPGYMYFWVIVIWVCWTLLYCKHIFWHCKQLHSSYKCWNVDYYTTKNKILDYPSYVMLPFYKIDDIYFLGQDVWLKFTPMMWIVQVHNFGWNRMTCFIVMGNQSWFFDWTPSKIGAFS